MKNKDKPQREKKKPAGVEAARRRGKLLAEWRSARRDGDDLDRETEEELRDKK